MVTIPSLGMNAWIYQTSSRPLFVKLHNVGSVDFVGFAEESVSDGANVKVTTVGGINTNQSSLTVGKNYGILPTGTSLVALPRQSNPKYIIGTATSSTALYVSKGALR